MGAFLNFLNFLKISEARTATESAGEIRVGLQE